MLGAVQVLSARLALLEPAHLDHIEGRLHAIHTRMNTISEKKAAIEDADKQSKVGCVFLCIPNNSVNITHVRTHTVCWYIVSHLQYAPVFMFLDNFRVHDPHSTKFLRMG